MRARGDAAPPGDAHGLAAAPRRRHRVARPQALARSPLGLSRCPGQGAPGQPGARWERSTVDGVATHRPGGVAFLAGRLALRGPGNNVAPWRGQGAACRALVASAWTWSKSGLVRWATVHWATPNGPSLPACEAWMCSLPLAPPGLPFTFGAPRFVARCVLPLLVTWCVAWAWRSHHGPGGSCVAVHVRIDVAGQARTGCGTYAGLCFARALTLCGFTYGSAHKAPYLYL